MPSVHSNFLPRPSSSIFSNKPLSFTCSSDPPLFQPSEHISSEACYRLYTLYFINAFLADRECEVRRLFAAVWVNWSLLARSKDNSSQRACISTLYWLVCVSIFFSKTHMLWCTRAQGWSCALHRVCITPRSHTRGQSEHGRALMVHIVCMVAGVRLQKQKHNLSCWELKSAWASWECHPLCWFVAIDFDCNYYVADLTKYT